MTDPPIVERGLAWPNCCADCKSQGPGLVDTLVDLNGAFTPDPQVPATSGGYGRLYLCKLCVRKYARACGYTKGKRMDQLENADVALGLKEKENATLIDQVKGQTEAIAERDRRLRQQQIVIDALEKREETRQHIAGIIHASSSELVGVGS